MTINNGASIQVMGRAYHIACPQEKINELNSAAKLVNDKIHEIKALSKIIDNEKAAVMAALNLANELLFLQSKSTGQDHDLQDKLSMLCSKVEKALAIA